MLRQLSISLILITLVSCATGGRDERFQLKNYYTTGAYDQGLKFLEESKFFKEDDEKLLYLMEKGVFLHQKGEYEASNLIFDQAINLVSQNYTISASKKVEKSVLNDNYDKFYGEIYEQSMLYFYSSLNSILIYNKTQDRNTLFKARASILAWDSFLNSLKEDRLGKSVYKKDLLLKIYGAKIHELISTREDINIALNLYKEAEDVLFKNYYTYQTFNKKAQVFKDNYDKLPKMKLDEVKKNYVDETEFSKDLKNFLKKSIERLNAKKNESKENITILLEKDVIAAKIADKTKFGMEGLANEPFLRLFVANILGLYPTDDRISTGNVYGGMAGAGVAMKLFTFSFELPKIENFKPYKNLNLIIKDKENKIIITEKINLINPMGDIAKEAIDESSLAVKARMGTRLAAKHISAIMSSFATYRALGGGGKEENFLARNAAVIQYAGLTRAIEASERADTRYWSTLPNEVRLCDLSLAPGEYTAELEIEGEPVHSLLGNFKIIQNNPEKILVFRK